MAGVDKVWTPRELPVTGPACGRSHAHWKNV